jgi:hypothetical protein
MSAPLLKAPGVYRQESVTPRGDALPTGVPAFIGFVPAEAIVPDGVADTAQTYGPMPLYRKTEFIGGAVGFLTHAINGFFDNGGAYCYVVGVKADVAQVPAAAAALIDALGLLAPLFDIDLVAIPDAVALRSIQGGIDESLVAVVQQAMIDHCMQQGNRVALLDALQGKSAQALLEGQVRALAISGAGPVNAALYHPWIRTVATGTQFVPPSGHIAGIIARTDAQAGVFRAPANAEIQGATDLDADLSVDAVTALNDAGVNCLRAFRARGIRVWGARTLSRDPDWRYLNVRRLVLTVLRWIDLNMTWVAFEPNVPALWARIQRELGVQLTRWWRAGALQGNSASEAFYIRCDAELNPAVNRESGQVVTQVGLAPTVPAEFIVVNIQHRAGTTELI